MTTTYAILATVTLQHDYYADGRCNDFEILPSAETAAAMRGLCILTRTVGNTLILLVKLDEAGKTFVSLPADLKLRFYLNLVSTDFPNFSHADLGEGEIYYLSNLFHTKPGSTLYLNAPVPAFSNAALYAIGDMVGDGGNVYEAIRPVSPGSHAMSDADFWQLRPSEQYVHSGDLLRLSDGILPVTVAPASNFAINVFSLNPATSDYDVLLTSQTLSFSENVSELRIDLSQLPPAKYRVLVNSGEHYVYVDKAASYARAFGVLELYNRFPAADDFGWLDADGIPKGLDYVVRFANRLAIWKYIARTTNVTAVENTAAPGAFEAAAAPKEFVSRRPLPLQQQPVKTLRLLSGSTVLASRIANPSPDRISTCIEDGNEYFCAEMYLNY